MDDVCVLLATYNGAPYLSRQVETIFQQAGVRVTLIVSDDGSTDGTLALLEELAERYGFSGHVHAGPRAGFAENFRSLITRSDITSPFVAFSDQDDVWEVKKLKVAIDWLKGQPADQPALYCSRTQYISEDERYLGLSPMFSRRPSVLNALVQSLGGGNTMVMNRLAYELVREASLLTKFVSHDWWCYQVVTGAGGTVHYDETSRILYRQHPGNQVGASNNWSGRLRRLKYFWDGGFFRWSEQNLASLAACEALFSDETKRRIADFSRARSDRNPIRRLYFLRRSGVYRQTMLGTLGLYAACFLRKL